MEVSQHSAQPSATEDESKDFDAMAEAQLQQEAKSSLTRNTSKIPAVLDSYPAVREAYTKDLNTDPNHSTSLEFLSPADQEKYASVFDSDDKDMIPIIDDYITQGYNLSKLNATFLRIRAEVTAELAHLWPPPPDYAKLKWWERLRNLPAGDYVDEDGDSVWWDPLDLEVIKNSKIVLWQNDTACFELSNNIAKMTHLHSSLPHPDYYQEVVDKFAFKEPRYNYEMWSGRQRFVRLKFENIIKDTSRPLFLRLESLYWRIRFINFEWTYDYARHYLIDKAKEWVLELRFEAWGDNAVNLDAMEQMLVNLIPTLPRDECPFYGPGDELHKQMTHDEGRSYIKLFLSLGRDLDNDLMRWFEIENAATALDRVTEEPTVGLSNGVNGINGHDEPSENEDDGIAGSDIDGFLEEEEDGESSSDIEEVSAEEYNRSREQSQREQSQREPSSDIEILEFGPSNGHAPSRVDVRSERDVSNDIEIVGMTAINGRREDSEDYSESQYGSRMSSVELYTEDEDGAIAVEGSIGDSSIAESDDVYLEATQLGTVIQDLDMEGSIAESDDMEILEQTYIGTYVESTMHAEGSVAESDDGEIVEETQFGDDEDEGIETEKSDDDTVVFRGDLRNDLQTFAQQASAFEEDPIETATQDDDIAIQLPTEATSIIHNPMQTLREARVAFFVPPTAVVPALQFSTQQAHRSDEDDDVSSLDVEIHRNDTAEPLSQLDSRNRGQSPNVHDDTSFLDVQIHRERSVDTADDKVLYDENRDTIDDDELEGVLYDVNRDTIDDVELDDDVEEADDPIFGNRNARVDQQLIALEAGAIKRSVLLQELTFKMERPTEERSVGAEQDDDQQVGRGDHTEDDDELETAEGDIAVSTLLQGGDHVAHDERQDAPPIPEQDTRVVPDDGDDTAPVAMEDLRVVSRTQEIVAPPTVPGDQEDQVSALVEDAEVVPMDVDETEWAGFEDTDEAMSGE